MPKSNSDADENDSLTSDDEMVSPNRASFAPRDAAGPSPRSPKSPVPTHRTTRSANRRRRPTMPAVEPSRINPSDKPIDKFRAAVRLVSINIKDSI